MTNYIPSPVKLPPRHFIFHFTIPFSNGKLLKRKDVQKFILLLRYSLFLISLAFPRFLLSIRNEEIRTDNSLNYSR